MNIGQFKRLLAQVGKVRRLKMSTRTDILVVDIGMDCVERCIPDSATCLPVPVRGEIWYVNGFLLVQFLIALRRRKRHYMGIRGCYVAAVAKSTKAKVITTYIDNNNWDIGLAEYLQIRIICIQNATRPRWYLNKLNKCFDQYLVYTPELANPGSQLNISVREPCIVGHLKMGIFIEDVKNGLHPDLEDNRNSIVWISTFREKEDYDDELADRYVQYTEIMQTGVSYMARYASERSYEPRIALSSFKKARLPDKEKQCLTERTEHTVNFSSSSGKNRSWISYKEIWAAQLVIGINSTLLFESTAIGKRTVFFLPTRQARENASQIAPFEVLQQLTISGGSYQEFAEKCDMILALSDREYAKIVNDFRHHVCYLDPDRLPQDHIKDKLEQALHGDPKPVITLSHPE